MLRRLITRRVQAGRYSQWGVRRGRRRTRFGNSFWRLGPECLRPDVEDLELVEGFLEVKGVPEKRRSISQLFQARFGAAVGNMVGSYDNQTTGGLDPLRGRERARHFFFMSACAAEVEVDTETGKVAVQQVVSVVDAGKAVNPRQCHLQNEGSMIMSLGSACSRRWCLITGSRSTRRF